MERLVDAGGGRLLAIEERGDPKGSPVFLLHGTPGSRVGPLPRSTELYHRRIRLIAYDRPGYGHSGRRPGRRVADAAADVGLIADSLGIERFAVVGRSGGGPHALACAALLPDRVSKAAVLVSLAPHDAHGLDWYAGMTDSNVHAYQVAQHGAADVEARLIPIVKQIRDDPASLFDEIGDGLKPSDLRVIGDVGIRSLLVAAYAEAVGRSAGGWIDDEVAFCRPWGFDPAEITAPVLLWHGADDRFSPVDHTRWLAERIHGATLAIETGASHFSALPVLPDILTWVVGAPGSPY